LNHPQRGETGNWGNTNLHRCEQLSGGHLELLFFSKMSGRMNIFVNGKTHKYAFLVVLDPSTNFGL
jgi:hypothetical protein